MTIFRLHERWAKVLDNSRYLNEEGRQKELENGALWLHAFEYLSKRSTDETTGEYGNPLEGCKHWSGNPIDVYYFLVKRDYNEVMLHAARGELEPIKALQP